MKHVGISPQDTELEGEERKGMYPCVPRVMIISRYRTRCNILLGKILIIYRSVRRVSTLVGFLLTAAFR